MNTKRLPITVSLALCALLLSLLAGQTATWGQALPADVAASSVGTAFTYQGQLKSDGTPYTGACDFQFALWDAFSGGSQIGTTQTKTSVSVADGYFALQLDFGAGAFQGEARWLAMSVRCPAGAGDYTPLIPRQPLTPAPYALYAAGAWRTTGNAGTTPGTNYLGTSDNVALELRVNGARALRLEPNATSPNLIGGYSGNWLTSGVYGATIGGGGESGLLNRVTDLYGTVGGGRLNTAGDDTGTVDDANYATVAGGSGNMAGGEHATVGGGLGGGASADFATISGGLMNVSSNYGSTIGGGCWNVADGHAATVGGGDQNTASAYGTFVGGGVNNTASGAQATVGGGRFNIASTNAATVSGGDSNTASGEVAAVGGGRQNTAGATNATVGGGNSNIASASEATVGGGVENTASGNSASVGGGSNNTASGEHATIGGGWNNIASGNRSVIGGGNDNAITAEWSATIAGGHENTASGNFATVGGGFINTAGGQTATVGGGDNNTASGSEATVGGGQGNTASGEHATVGGGLGNTASGPNATVPGGWNNLAQGDRSFAAGGNAKAYNQGCFVWADNNSPEVWCEVDNRWVARASGGVYFYSNWDSSSGVYVSPGGNSWNGVSDRAVKENFAPADGQAILDTLASLHIHEYNLKSQDPSIRHIGPVAQDFAAFGYGESDTAINMQDADGVALASIQALYGQVQALQAENADLEARLAALEAAAGTSGGSTRPWQWGLLPGLGLLAFGLVWAARRGGER